MPVFNPKELLLLEKAYLDEMTSADLKNDGKYFTKTDIKKTMRLARELDKAAEGETENDHDETGSVSGSETETKTSVASKVDEKTKIAQVGTHDKGQTEKRITTASSQNDKAAEVERENHGRGRPKDSKSKSKVFKKDVANEKVNLSSLQPTVSKPKDNIATNADTAGGAKERKAGAAKKDPSSPVSNARPDSIITAKTIILNGSAAGDEPVEQNTGMYS